MSAPPPTRRPHDDRLPGFLSMLGALVCGGSLGGLLGFFVGAPLAHRFGLSDSSGAVAYFVLFAAMPGCALFGAALALVGLFRIVRGGPS